MTNVAENNKKSPLQLHMNLTEGSPLHKKPLEQKDADLQKSRIKKVLGKKKTTVHLCYSPKRGRKYPHHIKQKANAEKQPRTAAHLMTGNRQSTISFETLHYGADARGNILFCKRVRETSARQTPKHCVKHLSRT